MKNLFLTILFLSSLVLPSKAITLSPSMVEIETEANIPKSIEFSVYNESKNPMKVTSFVWDLIIDEKGGKNPIPPIQNKKNISITKYIEPQEKDFTLEGKQTKIVKVLVNIPKEIKGGNAALVFFEAEPTIIKGKTVVSVATRLGATILQENKSTAKIKSRISEVQIEKTSPNNPINFKMSALNEGNTFITASATIGILGADDSFRGTFSTDKKIISPNSKVTFEKELRISLPIGSYNAIITYFYKNKNVTITKPFQIKN